MLSLLHIENIAVIERAELEFGEGFNVLTGETGAGKSIVIDALGAVLGARTSKELVRSGEKSALVTAVFSGKLPENWCEENGVEAEEDGLFLSRRISADGKNSCRVNGVPVPVASLRELGARLMDIHGQNYGLSLLDERRHLDYLDSFGDYKTELDEYRQAYSAWKKLYKEAEGLRIDASEKERISESLRYCIDELERANIQPGELEEKQAKHELLKNAVRLISALESAYDAIYGGSDSPGVLGCLGDAEGHIRSALRKYAELEDISDRLTELRYNAEDIAAEIRDRTDALDASPRVLEELAERVDLIKRLCRKYRTDEHGLIQLLEDSKKRLDDIEYADDRLKKAEKELKHLEAQVKAAGQDLSDKRLESAGRLEKRVVSEL
ncbi:MAG: AAA family ATPase, partial [Oscillospiraceae bacterium]|nr:AAA family ATPase [Oscillospiraceae bacterium]